MGLVLQWLKGLGLSGRIQWYNHRVTRPLLTLIRKETYELTIWTFPDMTA